MGRAEGDAARPGTLRIAVACSPSAGVAVEVEVEMTPPATAIDAVRASGLLERFPALAAGDPDLGIWGRAVSPGAPLRDGDRVELYRPLANDPQEARRLRARKRVAATRR